MKLPPMTSLLLAFTFGGLLLSCSGSDRAGVDVRSVEVDRIPYRVKTAGLGARRSGEPVVVFESGAGTPLENWDPVVDEVAEFAPLLAYDRSGIGSSVWDGEPPTPQHSADRLRELLRTLAIEPPYVLVAHSWGGVIARFFAGSHSSEVVGLLYVDPAEPESHPQQEIAILQSMGAPEGSRDSIHAGMARMTARMPISMRAEAAATEAFFESSLADRLLPSPSPAPTSVIMASRLPPPPPFSLPFDATAFVTELFAGRERRLREWPRNGGQFLFVDTGHGVHGERPDIVVEEIRRLVELAR